MAGQSNHDGNGVRNQTGKKGKRGNKPPWTKAGHNGIAPAGSEAEAKERRAATGREPKAQVLRWN